jgi:hypothetical protein
MQTEELPQVLAPESNVTTLKTAGAKVDLDERARGNPAT